MRTKYLQQNCKEVKIMEEENKTKKKKSFFKSKLFLFAILPIFFIMVVTAALTGFLSNTITWNGNVENPLVLIGAFESIVPHEMNTISTTLENKASYDIDTIVEVSIEATDEGDSFGDPFGGEFETLAIGIAIVDEPTCTSSPLYGDFYEGGYCYWDSTTDRHFTGIVDGIYYVQMGDGSVPILAEETLHGRLKIRFSEHALGNFEIEVKAVSLIEAKDLT